MLRRKLSACFAAAFLLIVLNFGFAFAQGPAQISGVFPQTGSPGTQLDLLARGDGFDNLPELSRVLINGEDIPFGNYAPVSNEAFRLTIRIPEQTVVRETEISFLFGDLKLDAYFAVTPGGERTLAPIIRQVSPGEGQVDTEIPLSIQGDRLPQLGALGGVIVAGLDIPVASDNLQPDGTLVIYLPPEIPQGETEIGVYFENASFKGPFLVRGAAPAGPGAPTLFGFSPQDGLVDTDVGFFLKGSGFFRVGDLVAVNVAGVDVPILYHTSESDASMVITAHLPPDLPQGPTGIVFAFENARFEGDFFVRGQGPGPVPQASPVLSGLSPGEGTADSEVELILEGENLSQLGDLNEVSIGGVEIPTLNRELLSDQNLSLRVYLPPETPRGDQSLSLAFENASFEDPFFVRAPSRFPIEIVVIVVVVVVGGGGILMRRRFTRERKPSREKPGDDKPPRPPAGVDFILSLDPGIQSVEPAGPSLTMDIDLRFEVKTDPGEQSVEPDGDSFVKPD